MRQTGKHCPTCEKQTLHRQEGTARILHLLLTLITCGFWLPVWLLLALNAHTRPWVCQTCGSKKRVFGVI